MRWLRRIETLRQLVRETRVSVDDIMCPIFVIETKFLVSNIFYDVQYRFSIVLLMEEI